MNFLLETPRLQLFPCDIPMFEKAIDGNEALAAFLQVEVPGDWTEFGLPALQYGLNKLLADPGDTGWWTYFPVHKQDKCLIGSGGFKGRPDKDGIVEIGYEIAPSYRNKGLATELATALIHHAFSFDSVHSVQAHTHAADNASSRVLLKSGFRKAGTANHEKYGLLWKWEIIKPAER